MKHAPFVPGEFYHIYNRGVDKRNIFSDEIDVGRFVQSIVEFNVVEPIGSIYENSFIKNQLGNETSKFKSNKPMEKLVNIVAYCLNPNHFHFILEPKEDVGISEFMKRLSGGYTRYFNNRYSRTGSLFQGVFKSSHIDSNEYLLYLSAYVNINNKVHQLGNETSKLVRNSFWEYEKCATTKEIGDVATEREICSKDIILDQFKDRNDYIFFVKDTVSEIARKRKEDKDLEAMLLE